MHYVIRDNHVRMVYDVDKEYVVDSDFLRSMR